VSGGNPKAVTFGTLHDLSAVRTMLAREGAPTASAPSDARVRVSEPAPPSSDDGSRYLLVRELGRGGMGRVDELFDRALGRRVARKACLPDAEDVHASLLLAEAQTCAQLEHPSVAPVYDVVTDDAGSPSYTMRVVAGRTLRDVLRERAADGAKTLLAPLLAVMRQVCLTVEYAHSRGVVHRDLKPDNVIVGSYGEVYVLDWGIAHLLEGASVVRDRDVSLTVAGTPGYMAPEQAIGGHIDARTDVFALGVMLYEIVAGGRPFEDADVASVLRRATRDFDVVAPSIRSPSVATDAFDSLILAAVSRDRERRPASARSLADAIDAFLDGERARAERAREADEKTREGEEARRSFDEHLAEAERLRDEAERRLATLAPWETAAAKAPAWALSSEASRRARDAALSLARAEAAFASALSRLPTHAGARRGMAALYYRQLLGAEARGDTDRAAQCLALARTYDDGELRLELADEGELVVDAPEGSTLALSRYEAEGPRLVATSPIPLEPHVPVRIPSGSHVLVATQGARTVRHPVVIARAFSHRASLVFPEVPSGFVVVPGGPFLAASADASGRLTPHELPDFAIATFPVTFGEYCQFLATLDDRDLARRTPRHGDYPLVTRNGRAFVVADDVVEGPARRYAPGDRTLDLPVVCVSWWDAAAYVRWLRTTTGKPFRLPTDLEWEKAARGADGRAYPMATALDASFCKRRESRPEAAQLEPVGAFELDESPHGVRDLAGGVADWTATADGGGTLDDEEREDVADNRQALWRGGSWSTITTGNQTRAAQLRHHRGTWIGFRVALGLPEGSRMTSARMNGGASSSMQAALPVHA
jgi:serine/threonine-protein kinase